jgi:hypothetical protein
MVAVLVAAVQGEIGRFTSSDLRFLTLRSRGVLRVRIAPMNSGLDLRWRYQAMNTPYRAQTCVDRQFTHRKRTPRRLRPGKLQVSGSRACHRQPVSHCLSNGSE